MKVRVKARVKVRVKVSFQMVRATLQPYVRVRVRVS